MMRAAVRGVEDAEAAGYRRPRIVAVTVLTSIDAEILNRECGVSGSVEDQVLHLATLAVDTGLDGIVCAAADLHGLKDALPPDFLFVTPGIKGTTTPAGADQKRVMSPGRAVAAGSSLLVVGRAITGAEDRPAAARQVLADITSALED